jgi:aspartyl/asparaginyl beta-hydroxylase (cupin superfamily)
MLSPIRKGALSLGAWLQRESDRLYLRAAGGKARPVFFDTDRTLPELRVVDENVTAIREELLAILPRKEQIPRYHEVDGRQSTISAQGNGSWHTFFVSMYGVGDRLPNRNLCPRTVEIVERIPGLIQAFFSILDAKKCVPAHDGPHQYYLRYHTGLIVPREKPPRIRVKDRYYTWKEGESLLFDDSWNHEVENQAESERVVLIVDVARPRPWYLRALLFLAFKISLLGIEEHEWGDVVERARAKV